VTRSAFRLRRGGRSGREGPRHDGRDGALPSDRSHRRFAGCETAKLGGRPSLRRYRREFRDAGDQEGRRDRGSRFTPGPSAHRLSDARKLPRCCLRFRKA
jgi:hypothetical protein